MKKKKLTYIKLLAVLLLTFSKSSLSDDLIVRQKYIMGTYITLKLPPEYEYLFKPSFNIFKKIDSEFSIYKGNSPVSMINKYGCYNVPDNVINLTKISKSICKITDGYFNIAIGRITKELFGFGTGKERIPDRSTLSEAIKGLSCDSVKIKGNTVCINRGVKLDFGGIAKGYAVDKVYEFLIKKGVRRGVILAGGDIRCISECEIFIKNPFKNGNILKLTLPESTGISTSGNYERFVKNKAYNHLINPKTGNSQNYFASVTLVSKEKNTLLDAYTTAISVMPLKRAISFLKSHREFAGILITNDRKILITENIKSVVKTIQKR